MAKQMNNKKIFIKYCTIDNSIYENNKMRISTNKPLYDKYKELYLYELFYLDFLEEKVRKMLSSNFNEYQFYDSFFIELNSDEFDQVTLLLKEESDLEKDKWSMDVSMLNLAINTLRNDPKMWEV